MDIGARLIGSYGSDRLIAEEAWMSTEAHSDEAVAEEVAKVVQFLVKHRHSKPLEVVHFHFEVWMPISIDRQFQTHRTQEASVANSGRYGSVPNEFYLAPNPGMEDNDYYLLLDTIDAARLVYDDLLEKYKTQFGKNRAREILRDVLPQGQMTRRKFIINLWAFAHMMKLRRSRHAQSEARELANSMLNQIRHICPVAIDALQKEGLLGED